MNIRLGDITFDIDLNLIRSSFDNPQKFDDITNTATPLLWNYKLNKHATDDGMIKDRIITWGGTFQAYAYNVAPLASDRERKFAAYDSGKVQMEQVGNKIRVKISDYQFDGNFPIFNFNNYGAIYTTPVYTKNIGSFHSSYFQILVPDNEETTIGARNYYLTVKDENFKAQSKTANTTTQVKQNDDSIRVQHVLYKRGGYSQGLFVVDNADTYLSTSYGNGDGFALLGQTFQVYGRFGMNHTNDDNILDVNKFVKFDGDAFEPLKYSDGDKHKQAYLSGGTMKFDTYYVTKKDGTNWNSQTEMNQTNIQELNIYEEITDIPNGHKCVGMYFESNGGYIVPLAGPNNEIRFRLKIKETANIGQTYGLTHTTQGWLDKIDRSIYTIKNTSYPTYPTPTFDAQNPNYIKTEYNADGTIIAGTHNGGHQSGQTVLVVGADLRIQKTVIDENEEEKINYDMGRNEYDVTYKLEPQISKNGVSSENIEGIRLKVEDTLPKGLTYVGGSSNRGEPEVKSNEDGTTTLIWYLTGISTGEAIKPIIYQAHIFEDSENGQQYENHVIVSEELPESGISKIGTTRQEARTATKSIQIINLASHRLYKNTDTAIIEKDGMIHYRITYANKLAQSVPDFQLLDILPYNGDGRGTKINGSYDIEKIEIKQTNKDGAEIPNSNVEVFTTTNEYARGIDSKNTTIGDSRWTKETSYNLNKEAKALAIKGNIGEESKLVLDIYLKTKGNYPEDIYINSAKAQTDKNTEEMQTARIKTEVVKREISGKVWIDTNQNGKQDNGEKYLSGIKLRLVDSSGNDVEDVFGNKVQPLETNNNGAYVFTNLKTGTYKVIATDEQNRYIITIKHAQGVAEDKNSDSEIEGNQIVIKDIELQGLQENVFEYKKEYLDVGFIEAATLIETPTKAVVQNNSDINKKTIMPGEAFEYEIKQKVNVLNTNIYGKYTTFEMKDVLPQEVEYVSSQIEKNGTKINANSLKHTNGTVEFIGDQAFLDTMEMNGETYTLRIKVKAKSTITKENYIKNKGITVVNGLQKETNEVENPVKDPDIKTPTKDILINGITSNGKEVLPGQTFEYEIKQTVNKMNQDIYAKYDVFKLIDVLPQEVEYVSAQIEKNGVKINANALKHVDGTVTFEGDKVFLDTMEMNGETYTLRIKVKAKDTLTNKDIIKNKGITIINNNTKETNEVTNPIKEPNIKKPLKNVTLGGININGKEIMPGQAFEYEINQTVNKMNQDIYTKYNQFVITDELPEEVDYVSAQIEKDGIRMNAGQLSYDKDSHRVTFDANDVFLKTMQMNGETYTLRVKVKAKDSLKNTDAMINKGITIVNNNTKETNEVENPIKEPDTKKPIKDVVLNNVSINGKEVMPGQAFEYVIKQQVNKINHDIYTKYETFVMTDKLPEEVEYVSSQIEKNGKTITVQNLSYNKDTHTVIFDGNEKFLNEIEMNEETYTLRIKVKAKETLRDTDIIKNKATTNVHEKEQTTNEVTNNIKEPNISKPTKMNYDTQGNEIGAKDVYPGDTIIYEVNQKVNIQNKDIYTKYKKFILSDKLDSKVSYQKAELLKNNNVITVEGIEYDENSHTVTFIGNETFLKNMEMNGETYTLRIYTKVNKEIKENDIIENIGNSQVQDSDKDTNEVTNKVQVPKGKIEFLKLTKQLVGIEDGELKYASLAQADVTYKLFAKEDIKYGDGTLIHEKATSFGAKTTDETGIITFEDLYEGIYELKEIAAPNGIVLDTKPIEVTVKATEDGQEIINVESGFENQVQEVKISGIKEFETEIDNEFKPSNGATFGIYHAKEYKINEEKSIPKDTLVAEMQTDSEGKYEFQGRLIPGQIYYIKETSTKDNYLLYADTKYFVYNPTSNEEVHSIELYHNGYVENDKFLEYINYELKEDIEENLEENQKENTAENNNDTSAKEIQEEKQNIQNIRRRTEEFDKNIIDKNGNRVGETVVDGTTEVTFELKALIPNYKEINKLRIIDILEPVFRLKASTVKVMSEGRDITKEGILSTNNNTVSWTAKDAKIWMAKEITITFDIIVDEVSHATYEKDEDYYKIPNKARLEIDETAIEDEVHVKVKEKRPIQIPFAGFLKENKNMIFIIVIIIATGIAIKFGYQYYKKEKE